MRAHLSSLSALIVLATACAVHAGMPPIKVVEIVAGGGPPNAFADGLLAKDTNLPNGVGCCIDRLGNVYYAQQFEHVIRKVDVNTQVVTTVAGVFGIGGFTADGVAATTSQLNFPFDVAVDDNFNLYIADASNNRIRKVDGTTGIITTIAGTGTFGFSGDGGDALLAQLADPRSVAVTADGNTLYFADTINQCVRRVNLSLGTPDINTVAGNATLGAGFSGDGGVGTAAQLNNPFGIACSADGMQLVIADSFNNRIRGIDFSVSPNIQTIAGDGRANGYVLGANPIQSTVFYPKGVAIQGGTVYISEESSSRIRKLTPDYVTPANGTLEEFAGGGGSFDDGETLTEIFVFFPADLAVCDSPMTTTNDILIAVPFEGRIRKITDFDPPALISPTTATANQGVPFTYSIVYTGTPSADVVALPLPAGLSLVGLDITGTPTVSGVFMFDITVQHPADTGAMFTDTIQVTLTINATAPTITSATTASGTVGVPFNYTVTASGTAPITFGASGLPAGLTFDGTTISGTPTTPGMSTVVLTATGTSVVMQDLTISIASTRLSLTLESSQNPVKTGVPVSFTATTNVAATITWDFGDGTPTVTGQTVTHTFGQENIFQVLAIATSALAPTASATLDQEVLAPNSGGIGVPNISQGEVQVTNPDNGIGIRVLSSDGGVVELAIDTSSVNRGILTAVTDFDDFPSRSTAVIGLRPVHKYTRTGVFTATSDVFDEETGEFIGRVRKTIAVSRAETGETAQITAQPSSRDLSIDGMSGKFSFTRNTSDTASFSGTLELPAGMDLTKPIDMSVAIGNVAEMLQVDGKGRARTAGRSGKIKKLTIKFPKLAKGSTVTEAGQRAKIDIQLASPDLDANGFDTEGITPRVNTTKAKIDRTIQVAVVLAGVSYEIQAPVSFTPSEESGAFVTRKL